MFGNISLLFGLCVVCLFITKARGDVFFSTITRGYDDNFTTDFCGKCSHFNAKEDGGHCKCESAGSDSVFVRSEKKCKSGKKLRELEGCLYWAAFSKVYNVKVINAREVNSTYQFFRDVWYSSCQMTPVIAFLDTAGKWQPFNLSADVLQVIVGDPNFRYSMIKIARQSPSLTNLTGHILKLDLNCTMKFSSESVIECLMFRIKGVLNVSLCNYTATTTASPTTTRTDTTVIPSTAVTPSIAVTPSTAVTPSIAVTPSTTVTPTIITTTGTPLPLGGDHDSGIITAIVVIGTVLCLALIGAFVFLYKHHYISCQSRNSRPRELDDVAGQQTYRVQEEPFYEVIYCNGRSTGNSAEICEGKHLAGQSFDESVLLNAYMNDGSLSRQGPLPSRPDDEEETRVENVAVSVYPNREHEVIEERDVSMVLSNPGIQETLPTSLPRTKSDFVDLPEACDEEVESPHHVHQHHESVDGTEESEDIDYQRLVKEKRAQSMFVCPSCNENSDYQRLSRPGHCPHTGNKERKEKSASCYESLTLERGTRESFYASPLDDDEGAEDEEERNADGLPEYHTLEPEETESDQAVDEPVNHDYNVLEESEPASSELDEDKSKICDPPRETDEDQGKQLEPSVIANLENNPAFAVSCKKNTTEEPESACSERDADKNKTCDPRPSDEAPGEQLEPSVIANLENNPSYAVPCKKNTTEEPESACSERDADKNEICDPRPTDEDPGEQLEPSAIVNVENNPAYALPMKRSYSM